MQTTSLNYLVDPGSQPRTCDRCGDAPEDPVLHSETGMCISCWESRQYSGGCDCVACIGQGGHHFGCSDPREDDHRNYYTATNLGVTL